MSKWYKDSLRRTLLDMHIEDWNDEFMSQFDPEDYFQALKTANVSAAMIYVQSHVGLCYWPTESGVMHRGLIGNEDKMQRLFKLCRGEGIDVILYYSLIFNNRAYEANPGWRMRDINGNFSRSKGGRYGLCCPNNTEYREFTEKQIEEFCDYFDFEGVFFDMAFWPMICYCDCCKKRWHDEVGSEIPATIDWNDEKWLSFNRKRHEWMGEFAGFATDKVKAIKPQVSVEHQYGHVFNSWLTGVDENIAKASDYVGTDLYGGVKEQSFACKTWYNLTKNQPFQYMTSRCYPNLGEHTTTKSTELLRLCAMVTYMHHGASLFIDAIDPIGTIDKKVYEKMGEVFRETAKYEKYLKRGKMAYDVGIYFNLDGKMKVENSGIHVGQGEANDSSRPHLSAMYGAGDSLQKNHIPYGVVNSWRLDLFKDLRILVLPDVPNMKDREIEAVLDFVKAGGNLYLSGHSAPSLIEEVFGGKLGGLTEETFTYMAPVEGTTLMGTEYSRKYPLAMAERAVKLMGQTKGEVLATITLPYTVPAPGQMFPGTYTGPAIGEDDPGYRFSSIHSNPPGISTELPALLKGSYGLGTVIWSALPIERANRQQHSDIFSNIIRELAGGEGFRFGAEAADSVECILFDAPEYNQKILGLINLQEGFKTNPVVDLKVWVRANQRPQKVLRLPEEEPVEFSYENGLVNICIHRMDQYDMFVLQF